MEFLNNIKRHVYDQYLKMLHLNEQYIEDEFNLFREQAREHSINVLPNNITSVHVIDCIGDHEPINHTGIVEKMELSKAGITKITTKLVEMGFVMRSQLDSNRKEIYFELTKKGREVHEIHKKLHKTEESEFYYFLNGYSEVELQIVDKFMSDLVMRAEKRNAEGEYGINDDLKD